MKFIEKLEQKVKISEGKHVANHHLNGRLFPFHTRRPERVRFKDPFIEIIGLAVRYSLDKELVVNDIKTNYLDNISNKLLIDNTISENEIEELFSFDFSNISTPEMLKYFQVIHPDSNETKGKILLAKYIVELFRLKDNEEWMNFISQSTEELSLYDKVVNRNLPKLGELSKDRNEKFAFSDQSQTINYFNKDLSTLMQDSMFFMANIDQLISYYLFYYIISETMNIDQIARRDFDSWFAFDRESISRGRNASRFGYQLVLEKADEVLINQDLVDYINHLTGQPDEFYTIEEIYQDEELREGTTQRLIIFNERFASVIDLSDSYTPENDFNIQVRQLKNYLTNKISAETRSRYSRSFKEFSRLGFIRARGRLGYILNLSQELLLLFVGVIIGKNNKMLVDKFFKELSLRGIHLDSQSQRSILNYFEEINILEKLSDSGDAQYVKSIL